MSPAVQPSLSLWARDIVGDLKSAPDTFSSWDKCMAKSYCNAAQVVAGAVHAAVLLLEIKPRRQSI
ncbi:uncharacterized protein ACLA_082400 [Aspergillus clavatus NRRL 1]|uniref:Uncharacterized protein n=1 Tax=Aspergillus clavatus (strain ATCC 1007 / CBS 513.65 / DSM 816 / NCTC 3887 / NRRL 1 / QM 1276 / 107) TaxID=344612 RepID=A1CTB2_ASPCL|nr:uncharacterized protein ACLA_082400 [Aspergillus clavatus NRRL 1]EAW06549.1 hypothetical protein ACLA_082400 [Aspergillus clavatus NRRL 1]